MSHKLTAGRPHPFQNSIRPTKSIALVKPDLDPVPICRMLDAAGHRPGGARVAFSRRALTDLVPAGPATISDPVTISEPDPRIA